MEAVEPGRSFGPGGLRPGARRWPAGVLVSLVLAPAFAGCISGRVLSGYPGYPFVSFSIPSPPDSAFFELQRTLEAGGYPIDFTEREQGFIHTRPGPDPSTPMLLSLVIGEDPERGGWTEVWVAAYERTRDGDERVNPLDDERWSDLVAISTRLSERHGGTKPLGPDERAEGEHDGP